MQTGQIGAVQTYEDQGDSFNGKQQAALFIKEKGKNKGKGKLISEIPFMAQENIVEVVIHNEQLLS